MDIKLEADDFASPGELDLRSRLVDRIEQLGMGLIGGFGSGAGGMGISVLVVDEADGRERLTRLMQEVVPKPEYTIQVLSDEDDE